MDGIAINYSLVRVSLVGVVSTLLFSALILSSVATEEAVSATEVRVPYLPAESAGV